MIRQPIISVLGHVDSGKTTLLDCIRGSCVVDKEAGRITQHIGASEIPIENIRTICGDLTKKIGIDLKIKGLLFIDTPGHEAFFTLRKRGGSIADLAILIIDINEGFQQQTEESLGFLKTFKTPFVVAATKVDRIMGWQNCSKCFNENLKMQSDRVKDKLDELVYKIVGQFSTRGFESERFDRVEDFTKQIAIVPCSGTTGEGIPDLLMLIAGLSQKFLGDKIEIKSEIGKGTVLEIKEFRGLGMTMDVILYDGVIRKNDFLVIGGKEMIVTKVKALLAPEPLKEMRVEKSFRPIEEAHAAAGVKISANDMDKISAGSPLRSVRKESDVETVRHEIEQEIEEIEIETDAEGILIKTDTLGSLEAMIKILKDMGLSIKKAKVGSIQRCDIMDCKPLQKPLIFAFNVPVSDEIREMAKDNGVKIFSSNIIYTIIEDYKKWDEEQKRNKEGKLLEMAVHPGRMKILPGYVFRQSKPAIFGVEVLAGTIKTGYKLSKKGEFIGEIKELQSKGENITEAKMGDKVAVSVSGITVGRHVKEGDTLDVILEQKDLDLLEKVLNKLRPDEKQLLEEMKQATI
jgi:translation initiation factor 5B